MSLSDKPVGVGNRSSIVEKGTSIEFNHNVPIWVEDTQSTRIESVVRPTGGVNSHGPFEFIIPPISDAYLIMRDMQLYIKAKVLQSNGDPLTADDVVAPINLLGTTMWDSVEVYLNDYCINNGSASGAGLRGYLETLLSYDDNTKSNHLQCQMFSLDEAEKFQTMVKTGQVNRGFMDRRAVITRSQTFDLMAPIQADFLRSDKHLAPGNKLTIKMSRVRDEYLLNNAVVLKSYKLEIQDMAIYFNRIRLKENIPPPSIERYLFNRTELKKFPVAQGMTSYNFTLFSGGKMPKNIIIAQACTAGLEGAEKINPLEFPHFNINYLSLIVNGVRVPGEPYKPDFSNDIIIREFMNVYANTGAYRVDRGNCLTKALFKSGLTLFPFDLSCDKCNGAHLHPAKDGSISVEIGWNTGLTAPITILAMCVYDELITRHRNDVQRYISEEI